MKNSEIIRKESGLFVLRHYYGYPQRMISDVELSSDILTAKQMLGDWLSRVSDADIPEVLRQQLIDAISDSAPIQKASGGLVADASDRRRMMLDSPNYPIISSTLIGYRY
jgi:hypothetical protein